MSFASIPDAMGKTAEIGRAAGFPGARGDGEPAGMVPALARPSCDVLSHAKIRGAGYTKVTW
jgi:hypothetical protein